MTDASAAVPPEDLQRQLGEIRTLLANAPRPALLVRQADVPAFLGVSRACFFRLKSAGRLPAAVAVPGAGPAYRRADLERWVGQLKPARARKAVRHG